MWWMAIDTMLVGRLDDVRLDGRLFRWLMGDRSGFAVCERMAAEAVEG